MSTAASSSFGPGSQLHETARNNRLLESLALNDLDGIAAIGDLASFGANTRVASGGEEIREVYLPVSGYASLMVWDAANTRVQVALVGTEGMLGWESLLGQQRYLLDIYVPEVLSALRLDVGEIRALTAGNESWRTAQVESLTRLFALVARSALCARFHVLEARLARCLLEVHDRHPEMPIRLTQGTLADLLGVRRSGVTSAATHLQLLGLIQYRRGQIRLVDRPGLEAAACECYRFDTR